nr:hypothetical protein DWF04_09775 [Cereibacter sphaeroides f. sp. denitrificans]
MTRAAARAEAPCGGGHPRDPRRAKCARRRGAGLHRAEAGRHRGGLTRAAGRAEAPCGGDHPRDPRRAKWRKIRQPASARRPQDLLPPICLLPCGEIAPGHIAVI